MPLLHSLAQIETHSLTQSFPHSLIHAFAHTCMHVFIRGQVCTALGDTKTQRKTAQQKHAVKEVSVLAVGKPTVESLWSESYNQTLLISLWKVCCLSQQLQPRKPGAGCTICFRYCALVTRMPASLSIHIPVEGAALTHIQYLHVSLLSPQLECNQASLPACNCSDTLG